MDLLHLGGWKAFFYHENETTRGPLKDCFAQIMMNKSGRVVDFTLSKTLPKYAAMNFDPWLHGKHEACELLLGDLDRGCREIWNNYEVTTWTHSVIRRLERALPGKPTKET